jgi:hypothetical protein
MSSVTEDPLAALRDIHLPPDPGWWPPAPGYWLLAAVIILFVAVLLWRRYRQRRARSLRAAVRAEIERVGRTYADHKDDKRLLNELAELLRLTALVHHGAAVAGLSGDAWAQHLAATSPAPHDTRVWEWIALSRYQPDFSAPDPDKLFDQCRRWLEHTFR